MQILALIIPLGIGFFVFLFISYVQASMWRPLIKLHYLDPKTGKPLEVRYADFGYMKVPIIVGRIALGFEDLRRKTTSRYACVEVPAAPWMLRLWYRFKRKGIEMGVTK